MELALSEEERTVLAEILQEALPNLREEVYRTESFDYREQLKQREAVVKDLLTRLGASS